MPDLYPVFSIIMPAYNREALIRQALDSVKAQTYRPGLPRSLLIFSERRLDG